MKKKLRSAVFIGVAFFLMAAFYPGFSFRSPQAIALATGVYVILYLFVKPLLKILSIPFNLFTFGLFSLFANVLVLYLLALLVPNFQIIGFKFSGVSWLGIQTSLELTPLFSALAASVTLSFLASFFFWLFV
jgi:putative membrane protein